MSTLYRFGNCELHVGQRELRIDGRPIPLEPLAFELLAYLLRQRARVVSKDELLDTIWRNRIVSVGSLARAMKTVRQGIGDNGDTPLIRTVHRIGYHFVAAVEEHVSPPPIAAPAGSQTCIRIALLPCENLTGDLALDWTTLGLMALVGNALALHHRMLPMSVHAVCEALRGLPAGVELGQRVDALRRRGGVQEVVQTGIVRVAGGFRLDYQLLTASCRSSGSVLADDPVQLGRLLARRLRGHLLAGPLPGADGFAPHERWILELFARAMQASSEGQWTRAARLLRVLLDVDPDYGEALRELRHVEALQRSAASAGSLDAL